MSNTLPGTLPAYAELHCLSNFSFLRGASHPEELVRRASALGYAGLAITDECSLAGIVRAHVTAKDMGLPLIIGSEIALIDGPRVVLLATNREGYGRLSSLITLGRRRERKGRYSLSLADLQDGITGCLAILCPDESIAADRLFAHATWFSDHFIGRSWIAAELLHGLNDRERLLTLKNASTRCGVPLVAAGDVHMHVRSRRRLQDVLTAIRIGKPVAECGRMLHPNGERHLRQRMGLARLYPEQLLDETVRIAELCTFSLDSLRYEYPEELTPPHETPATHLRQLAEQGLSQRFPDGPSEKIRSLIKQELNLIEELQYEPFFLTVHDIVQYAKSRGILCQGRGSAANSAVCYALGITEVNPDKQELLFGRFLSKERKEPPDIDVDFEHERREEVIQYIYRKYGRDRAALAATVIYYRPRSALRDAGKALGLQAQQVDRMSKSIAWWDDREQLGARLQEAGFDPHSPVIQQLVDIVTTLHGFPRHLSQHVGGFIISKGPLAELVPLENASMPDRTVIQWDKNDLDSMGLLKVDILALGMLSVIRRALTIINHDSTKPVTMDDLLRKDDPNVYTMIQQANTVGVFQIESRAQMSMLPRLRPENFYDLVIEVAIVRPGPIQGGMVHPYLKRRQGLEPITYPNERIRAVLERTLGIPIFQEQVMQLAVVAASFTAGESDNLRRSMAAWSRKGGLEHLKKRLIDGMQNNGYEQKFAEQIFNQILGFGEYGFPESHSASFALLTYVSAWLKFHQPAAFLTALLNSQPMGFYAPSQLVQDARRNGVTVLPVDIRHSNWECSIEGGAVRLGFVMINGLQQRIADKIIRSRTEKPFQSMDDLSHRTLLESADLKLLAKADALAPITGHRWQAYWQVSAVALRDDILSDAPIQETSAMLHSPTSAQDTVADYASTGLTLRRHPIDLLRNILERKGISTAEEIRRLPSGHSVIAAGLVTGRQRPGTASGVVFVTLEDETGWVNVIVWKDLGDKQRKELLASRLLCVQGNIEREGEVVHLLAKKLVDYSYMLGRLTVRSRDFH
jgi:error-prone DNA polymerase